MTRAFSYVANPVCHTSRRFRQPRIYGRRWRRDVRIAAKADALIAIHSARADFRRLEFGRKVFTRARGTALHPERDSLETLLKVRQEIGEYTFESQYQQNPQPRDGGVIKKSWLRHYERGDLPERFSYILQSWDTANKIGELNDYSVCTT